MMVVIFELPLEAVLFGWLRVAVIVFLVGGESVKIYVSGQCMYTTLYPTREVTRKGRRR